MTPAPRATPTQQTTLDAAPTTRVLRQFRVVFNAVKTHFRQVERKTGVGGAQLWALSVIGSNPGIGMNDLAHAMDVHQSTASNLVKSLVMRELIVAAKNGADHLQFRTRMESHDAARLDRNCFPCFRIAARPLRLVAQLEIAKA